MKLHERCDVCGDSKDVGDDCVHCFWKAQDKIAELKDAVIAEARIYAKNYDVLELRWVIQQLDEFCKGNKK